jgi:hypothetical protein
MTPDDDEPVRCICGKVWATVRTFDGTLYVIQRHYPGCPLTIDAALLPDPGPQGDVV